MFSLLGSILGILLCIIIVAFVGGIALKVILGCGKTAAKSAKGIIDIFKK